MSLKNAVPLVASAIIGIAGLALVTASEGLRTTSYHDPVGIPTSCFGHTGPEVRIGQRQTPQECYAILLKDLGKHQVYVIPGRPENCINNVPVTANQRDALTVFIFNVGGPNFCGSSMARKLKAKDYVGASREFPKWNRVCHVPHNPGCHVLRGLVIRREKERELFLSNQRSEPSDTFSVVAEGTLSQTN